MTRISTSYARSGDSSRLGLLFRSKLRSLHNRVGQAINDAPLRVTATALLIGVIWAGLWGLFHLVFWQFNKTPLEATVAIPLIFNFFFVAMLALLTFSNAIIAYGALFGRSESEYLVTSPLTHLDVVTLKYVESLVMSSWSLIVLGLPLMFALAQEAHDGIFYLLFVAFFLAFIPIPGSLGMLLAFLAARLFPHRIIRPLALFTGIILSIFVYWGTHALRLGDTATDVWLRTFLAKMSFVESAFLPNHWVAEGIDYALQSRFYESGMYLFVTVANALFLSWATVRLIARHFSKAYDRATAGRGSDARLASAPAGGLSAIVFFYLPVELRLIAAKDLRTFFRDPLQWSQLAILFGLLVLYLTNMPTLRIGGDSSGWKMVGPFLNLCAISLILATFTCRFVFPLVSLEGHTLWMIGLLPIPRGRVLLAKFAFAMTVTMSAGLGAMILAISLLELHWQWAVIHVAVITAICFGLCGFSVGIGARLPMFDQRNVARIANGLGGTTNLLASLSLVAAVLSALGLATWRAKSDPPLEVAGQYPLVLCAGAVALAIGAGMLSLWIGARHFRRVEV
ncbi:MAG: putative ABC transporter permease subunit [Planctomycetota bacterium]|jgi:ABC-2 type transport system permease protein